MTWLLKKICSHQGILTVVKFNEGYLGIDIDEGLLIDSRHSLVCRGSKHLGRPGSRDASFLFHHMIFSIWLSPGLYLLLGQDEILLSSFCFQGLERFLEGLQVVAEPDGPDTSRRDE